MSEIFDSIAKPLWDHRFEAGWLPASVHNLMRMAAAHKHFLSFADDGKNDLCGDREGNPTRRHWKNVLGNFILPNLGGGGVFLRGGIGVCLVPVDCGCRAGGDRGARRCDLPGECPPTRAEVASPLPVSRHPQRVLSGHSTSDGSGLLCWVEWRCGLARPDFFAWCFGSRRTVCPMPKKNITGATSPLRSFRFDLGL